MPNELYDLAIIGAGVFGCTIAHEVARHNPGTRTALFERTLVGHGCSAFAGALASPSVRSEALREWSDYSRNWYQTLRARHTDAPLREIAIGYCARQAELPALSARLGASLHALPPQQRPNWLVLPEDACLYAGAHAVRANVSALCRHLLSHSQGVTLFEGCPITQYQKHHGLWHINLPDGREYAARQLVLAKGAWLEPHEQAATLPVRRKKIVSWILDFPAAETDGAYYFDGYESFLMAIPERAHWVLSILSLDWDCHPDTARTNPADLQNAQDILTRFAPSLLAHLHGARVHVDTYAEQHQGGVAQDAAGALVACGGSGSGFRYAPAVARAALNALAYLPGGI